MHDDQIKAIVGLFAGVELAVVHTANILVNQGIASRDEIAASYRKTATNIEAVVTNRDLIIKVLDHIASGIEGSSPPPSPADFLRLIKGGQPDPPDEN